jgi:hypothetical protein
MGTSRDPIVDQRPRGTLPRFEVGPRRPFGKPTRRRGQPRRKQLPRPLRWAASDAHHHLPLSRREDAFPYTAATCDRRRLFPADSPSQTPSPSRASKRPTPVARALVFPAVSPVTPPLTRFTPGACVATPRPQAKPPLVIDPSPGWLRRSLGRAGRTQPGLPPALDVRQPQWPAPTHLPQPHKSLALGWFAAPRRTSTAVEA